MTRPKYFIVLFETAGNQQTIFQTNRLRENIGASELIHRAGTSFVIEASGFGTVSGSAELQALLLDNKLQNRPIEQQPDMPDANEKPDDAVELILATSGKALLLVRNRERGEAIIRNVTLRALREAPAIALRGAITEVQYAGAEPLAAEFHQSVMSVHARLANLRGQLPDNALRFQRLPIGEPCSSSDLPAGGLVQIDKIQDPKPLSDVVASKLRAASAAHTRVRAALGGLRLTDQIGRLEDAGYRWAAIVHADGNGLGQVFLDFAKRSKATTMREYIDRYRRFSLAIDECARQAAGAAIVEAWGDDKTAPRFKPVIPVVLGGDDLTVICEGTAAVRFAAAYLRNFESKTAEPLEQPLGSIICEIVGGRLSAAAGIAVVKPHFPFHRAYDIAASLTTSAKQVKRQVLWAKDAAGSAEAGKYNGTEPFPCSALDFQVVFESSGSELDVIRERFAPAKGIFLTCRPYIVTPDSDLEGASHEGKKWAANRRWDGSTPSLLGAVAALRARAEEPEWTESGGSLRNGDAALPRSQQHDLVEAVMRGPDAAALQVSAIAHRYAGFDWSQFGTEETVERYSLFFSESLDEAGHSPNDGSAEKPSVERTRFVDAMELADLEGDAIQ